MNLRKRELGLAIKKAFVEKGVATQPRMVVLLGKKGIEISQPTLSRILQGRYARVPKSLTEVCRYSRISLNKFRLKTDPAKSVSLMNALRVAWDGSPERERLLARVIMVLGKASHDR